jgi:DNA-directed RNA polymerase specialized sigma24 family protein
LSEESRFRRLVHHLTRTRSGGKEDAEDLAQEIAIRLLKIPDSHIGCEDAYINRCTRNARIDQHRKWKRQPLELELSEITEAAMYKAALYSDPQETLRSLHHEALRWVQQSTRHARAFLLVRAAEGKSSLSRLARSRTATLLGAPHLPVCHHKRIIGNISIA